LEKKRGLGAGKRPTAREVEMHSRGKEEKRISQGFTRVEQKEAIPRTQTSGEFLGL